MYLRWSACDDVVTLTIVAHVSNTEMVLLTCAAGGLVRRVGDCVIGDRWGFLLPEHVEQDVTYVGQHDCDTRRP